MTGSNITNVTGEYRWLEQLCMGVTGIWDR